MTVEKLLLRVMNTRWNRKKSIKRDQIRNLEGTHSYRQLPEEIIRAKNMNTFKNRLDRYWRKPSNEV